MGFEGIHGKEYLSAHQRKCLEGVAAVGAQLYDEAYRTLQLHKREDMLPRLEQILAVMKHSCAVQGMREVLRVPSGNINKRLLNEELKGEEEKLKRCIVKAKGIFQSERPILTIIHAMEMLAATKHIDDYGKLNTEQAGAMAINLIMDATEYKSGQSLV